MKIFYPEHHAQHAPAFEVFDGGVRVPYQETPERVELLLDSLRGRPWAEIHPGGACDPQAVLAVHTPEYVEFLRTAYEAWGREPTDYAKEGLLPATFAPRGTSRRPRGLLGRAGYHMSDLSAPILAGTYQTALDSAACALDGARALRAGDQAALALCRPPGHHAGRERCAGYCYLNNAAIAAQSLSGTGRVAIVDIDYHAGDGTQEIFYQRADVLTVSLHADPDGAYPYYRGYAGETGAGAGAGCHRNFPLPDGTGDRAYLAALDQGLELVAAHRPSALVVSAGLDLCAGDPLGTFEISAAGLRAIGARLGRLAVPTLFVLEGGYARAALGENLLALLEGFSA